ncbi:MAG: Eco57I restriction-modification methylase domain-containing protein [Candidatus Hermodarchaeota archaeon]
MSTFESSESGLNSNAVTKEFYDQYMNCTAYLIQNIQGVPDSSVKSQLVQTLQNRLFFLWFLQLTGSLDRDPQYLLTKFQARRHRSFYRGFLRPLFQALSTPRTQRTSQMNQLLGEVPYLGAGLFLPTMEEERFAQSLDWPDETFYHSLKHPLSSKTTDIPLLDLFKSRKWSLDGQFGTKDALTPHFLGYMFEQSEQARSLGVVYTPDAITANMCKSALLEYINNNLYNGYETHEAIVSEENTQKQKTILNCLKNIKIVDPACGTGHFLLAMLYHLEKIYIGFKESDSQLIQSSELEIREHIIRNNLFGVDLLPQAVEICKLRLFLSLVEKYEGAEDISPLPNIDFRIRSGNSVIGYYERLEKLSDFFGVPTPPTSHASLKSLMDERNELIKKYEKAANQITPIKRKLLKTSKILQLLFTDSLLNQRALEKTKEKYSIDQFNEKFKPFHWTMEFSDILAQGGFDIVIGNPPYVKADSQDNYFKECREIIERLFKELEEKWDLYIAFMELGVKLLKPGGLLSFIISDSFSTANYARRMRKLLLSKRIIDISFFPDVQIFHKVGVHNISIAVKNEKAGENFTIKRITYESINKIKSIEIVKPKELGERMFRYSTLSNLLFSSKISNTIPLGDICYVSIGMIPNSDEKRYRGEFKKNDLISSKKSDIHCKTYIENKYIEKFGIMKHKYLEYHTDRVPAKVRRPTFPELYTNEKIFVGKMGGRAVFDDQGIFSNDSLMIIVPYHKLLGVETRVLKRKKNKEAIQKGSKISPDYDMRYLLGIINSSHTNAYLNTIRSHRQENFFNPNEIKQIPIFKAKKEQQNNIVRIVRKLEKNRELKKENREEEIQKGLDEEYEELIALLNKNIEILYNRT